MHIERRKSVLEMAMYACNRHHRWHKQAAWTKISVPIYLKEIVVALFDEQEKNVAATLKLYIQIYLELKFIYGHDKEELNIFHQIVF